MIDYIFFFLIIFIIYILFAEFFIEKKLSEMPQQTVYKGECNCNQPKIIIEKMTNFNSLIKKPEKKKIVNWNDYFEKSQNIFTTKDLSSSYFLKKSKTKT